MTSDKLENCAKSQSLQDPLSCEYPCECSSNVNAYVNVRVRALVLVLVLVLVLALTSALVFESFSSQTWRSQVRDSKIEARKFMYEN